MKLRALGLWANLLLSSALMLVVWVLLVWIGSRPAIKSLIDLSPQQRATIDPVTVELLKNLPEQSIAVEFHMFFEPPGPEPQDAFQQQRVRILARLRELTEMLLRQYAFHGGESVTVENHAPYGDIARYREAAQRFGITQSDVVVVAVKQSGRPPRHRTLSLEGDLGVVEVPQLARRPNSLPAPQVPVLKDYKGEEALSSALKSLLVQGTPVVYFLNSANRYDLDFSGASGVGYLSLLQMLDSLGFDHRELSLRNGVPKDASVVVVLEPRTAFSDSEVSMLYEYVQHGGRLVLDYSFVANQDWNVGAGELGKLLGFDVGDRQVMHLIIDPTQGMSVRGLDGNPRVSKLDLVMNPNHPVTLRLARGRQFLQVDQARELLLPEPAPKGVRREPLLMTGPQGWLAVPGTQNSADYFRAPKSDRELRDFMVGAAIEVDGVPGPDGKAQNGAVIVVTGMFCNTVGMGINADLAANIFNWLTERRVLLDIRGSSYVSHTLKVQQQQFDRVFWFLIGGVPAVFLVGGLFVGWRRRRS